VLTAFVAGTGQTPRSSLRRMLRRRLVHGCGAPAAGPWALHAAELKGKWQAQQSRVDTWRQFMDASQQRYKLLCFQAKPGEQQGPQQQVKCSVSPGQQRTSICSMVYSVLLALDRRQADNP
jgi:hypothetical protein